MKIGARGQLQEWQEGWDAIAPEQNHGHAAWKIHFGATAGVSQWLLQSHAGEPHLLPALPPALPDHRVPRLLREQNGLHGHG
nr:hypothetical protein [Streptomyces cyaneochromogenes]